MIGKVTVTTPNPPCPHCGGMGGYHGKKCGESKMKPFTVEGSVCFANVPPGFRVKMERYDMHSDGTVRWALTIAPEPKKEELQDADIDEDCR